MNSTARLAALALLLTAACGAPRPTDTGAEPTGETSLALTSIPTGVQCVQITATGSSTVSKSFAVTAGASSVGLALGELPLGNVAIAGQAFNAACASIAGTSPTYVADPQTVVLKAGLVTNLTMTFRPDNPVNATANFLGDVAEIVPTGFGTYFLMSDGTVRAAGLTPITNSPTVIPVPGLTNVAQIAASDFQGCALLANGTAQCWGHNSFGQLGNGSTTNTTAPVNVVGISSAVHLVVGNTFTCALLVGGTVECWGYNADGELGNGTTTNSSVPVSVPGQFAKIAAAGQTACGITEAGGVQCWGLNAYGELGNGTTTNSSAPVSTSLEAVVALAAGLYHFCALRADGTVRCWGDNSNGGLGNGTYTNSSTPVLVPLTSVNQIVAGVFSTCAKSSVGVYCWGEDVNGELGDGTGVNSPSPILLSALGPTTAIAGGDAADGFCAQMSDMTIDCWGSNAEGQLGNGTYTNAFVPIPIPMQ